MRDERPPWLLIGFVVYILIILGTISNAHDQKRPELDSWFKNLSSKSSGLCCNGSDATGLAENDWESKNGNYRVFVFGQWRDVPPNAVLDVPNLAGRTLVWVSKGYLTGVTIRCFMPGPMS